MDLSKMAQVTFATIAKVIDNFLKSGLIVAKDIGDSTGGRKPLLYTTKGTAYYAVGVKVSREKCDIILMNLNGMIVDIVSLPMTQEMLPDVIALKIRDAIREFKAGWQISNKLLGIGIAAIGPLDSKNGIILKPHNFPVNGWTNVPLVELVKNTTGLPVLLDSIARAGVLGESWYGSAKNLDNVVYIYADYGIGCGHIINGSLVDGLNDITSSLGHMIIDINGSLCACGRRGCLETYSASYVLVDQAIRRVKEGQKSILTDYVNGDLNKLEFKHISQGVTVRDPLCVELVTKAAWALGIALANFINLILPDMVVLGGNTILNCPSYYEIAVKTAIETACFNSARDLRFERASLGDRAEVIGAATQVFSHYLDN
jgi:N-acetylglucosamine repressor